MRVSKLKVLAIFVVSTFCGELVAESLETDERPALPFPPGVSVESQCGAVDNLQDVELYDGTLGVTREYVDSHEASTVQFQWLQVREILKKLPGYRPGNVASERWCSGTLISENLVLTAGHCFDVQRDGWISPFKFDSDGKPNYAEPSVLATLLQVNFYYQRNGETGAIRIPVAYPVERLVEFRRGGLDYALVELGRDKNGRLPGDVFKPERALIRSPSENERVSIIQHPQGKPKKVEAGNVMRSSPNFLWYDDLDTHSGSSGSGVRDKAGYVIGVHTNGGCRVNSGANKGVNSSAIAEVSDVL